MEFEEMQKIWVEQKGETMYAINEAALHKSIQRKKRAASRRINKVEISLMIINFICTIFLFYKACYDTHYWNLVTAFMMLGTVIYIGHKRAQRRQATNTFDRSMLGELDHAISDTDSIIHISRMMITGYLIPFSVLFTIKMVVLGASIDKWFLVGGMYGLAFTLVLLERKKMHLPRKAHLLSMRRKLVEDE